ncbi:MAG: ABC transporter permease subunit [Nitrososphaerota archaeon]|nr:ABC transporter permease [Candidatus Bathyarchaeota archaeon]MDW8022641.1 ABC transporter permease subunit [Nitrososphaerota archaeon]
MSLKTAANWKTRFWAVVKYELLWNIRKKKFLGMVVIAFVFATLALFLPIILSNVSGQPFSQNPDYVVRSGIHIGNFGLFLFAVVTVMNSISGEFESGTIVPLLTKPVSRTMVWLGKLLAAFITLFSAYGVLVVYMTVVGTLIHGPQNNLHLVPLSLLGSILSTFVWVSIVLAIGSISKSSMMAALGAFGIFIALSISSPIVSMFSEQAWVLNYVPGSGALGFLDVTPSGDQITLSLSVSTGTDAISSNLVNYALHPSANVKYLKIGSSGQLPISTLYSETLSFVLARAIIVALAYVAVFLFISWWTFKRAQVLE